MRRAKRTVLGSALVEPSTVAQGYSMVQGRWGICAGGAYFLVPGPNGPVRGTGAEHVWQYNFFFGDPSDPNDTYLYFYPQPDSAYLDIVHFSSCEDVLSLLPEGPPPITLVRLP
jgi:hypothetical protein